MKISCIIPIYNEGKRILPVLDAVCGHPLVDEVIVINDGSTDDSLSLLQNDPRIKLISYKENKGKTQAVLAGLVVTKNDFIMMLDSDLIGLTREDLTELILPVVSGQVSVSISLRGNSLSIYKNLGIDIFSGERVFDKKLFGDLQKLLSLSGFGLESYMNKIITKENLKIKIVSWPKVSHARKQEKVGYWSGLFKEMSMITHILKTMSIFTLVYQFKKMRSLAGIN